MTPSEALQWADKNCQSETVERLRSRAAAAALAAEVRRMHERIECLRGALKDAAGRAYEVAEFRLGDDCMEWAGDMEPPLMGRTTEWRGATQLYRGASRLSAGLGRENTRRTKWNTR